MKIRILSLVVAVLLLAVAPVSADTMRVGVVLSIGGLGDESFNDAAYQGIMQLRKEGDCIVEVVEPGLVLLARLGGGILGPDLVDLVPDGLLLGIGLIEVGPELVELARQLVEPGLVGLAR